MSLQQKFALLLALLGLTVAVSLAGAMWTFGVLEREVARPFHEAAAVVAGLDRLDRRLNARPGPPEPAENQGAHASELLADLAEVEAFPGYVRIVGVSTSSALRERAESAARAGAESDAAARDAAQIIARVRSRALANVQLTAGHGVELRERLVAVLALALLSAALVGTLALLLVRRWVTRPVAALRTAARRIAAGDFAHRLPIATARGDELAQLAAEVNHMAAMVSEMQEERVQRERLAAIGEVVRRLAHNIRNPLSGIRGLAELSRSDLPAGSEVRENQDRIVTTVDRFERWLSDLLGATSPLTIHPERRDVRPWLAGLVEAHRAFAQSRGVSLQVDAAGAPTRAGFDGRHLEQAVTAVLTNAIDASPAGAVVRVTACSLPEEAAWEIRIEDQGQGVPSELTDRIFAAHFTTKPDGNGIGLAVALQVVKGHGGRILVEPGLASPAGADGRGAAFVFWLPESGEA